VTEELTQQPAEWGARPIRLDGDAQQRNADGGRGSDGADRRAIPGAVGDGRCIVVRIERQPLRRVTAGQGSGGGAEREVYARGTECAKRRDCRADERNGSLVCGARESTLRGHE